MLTEPLIEHGMNVCSLHVTRGASIAPLLDVLGMLIGHPQDSLETFVWDTSCRALDVLEENSKELCQEVWFSMNDLLGKEHLRRFVHSSDEHSLMESNPNECDPLTVQHLQQGGLWFSLLHCSLLPSCKDALRSGGKSAGASSELQKSKLCFDKGVKRIVSKLAICEAVCVELARSDGGFDRGDGTRDARHRKRGGVDAGSPGLVEGRQDAPQIFL
ncbi:hypothetical protein FB451DRAFT_1195183 [Mycena latifolia]|nr:hypothetical protein FB451DRAFT_1195183 [Mycena latifolia]